MKKIILAFIITATVFLTLTFSLGTLSMKKSDEFQVAMVTDFNDVNDNSFNQACYEGGKEWSEKNNIKFSYYKPAGVSLAERIKSLKLAIDRGYDVILCPGFAFGEALNKTRYIGVLLSGLFAGLGGLLLITMNAEWEFANGASGFGFLALAVLIFGQWKPLYIFLGAFVFSLFKTLSVVYPSIDFLANLGISSYFYLALPYVVCLIVLIFTSKKNVGPKALGIPYDKGKR